MVCPYCQESKIATIQKDISGQEKQEAEFNKHYNDMYGQDDNTKTDKEEDNMKRRGVDQIIQQVMKIMTNDHTDVTKQDKSDTDIEDVYVIQEKSSLVQTLINRSTWLLDSGATVHVTNDALLLRNGEKVKQFVKVGIGAEAQATMIGQVDMVVEDDKRLRLTDVLFVPGFIRYIISLSKIVSNGVVVELHGGHVKFVTGGQELKLQKANHESMWTIQSSKPFDNQAMVLGKVKDVKKAKPKMDVMEAHEKLGHLSEKTTRLTVDSFGWIATGEMEPCDACLRHKAKAKGVSHQPSTTRATKAGERLFLDTTGLYELSAGGTKYDVQVVDQHTDMGWVAHVVQRNAVPKVLEHHCEYLEGKGLKMGSLRCNNAGEHQTKLKRVCEQQGFGVVVKAA
jgi:hypothetical protein